MNKLIYLLAAINISACANLNTINRTTDLATSGTQAIHLDVKQRLAFGNASKFCAEASPDALSAFSSGAGFAQGLPQAGQSISASAAAQESASSIGLRTQSIALQREIFYRICEAGYNDKISNAQIGVLLARSQDLTSVVLAVEQLTGAVVANQSSLTGNANSTAAAAISSNAEVIKLLKEGESAAKAEFDNETSTLKDLEENKLPAAMTEEKNAESAFQMASGQNPQPNNLGELKTDYEERKKERMNLEADIIAQKQKVEDSKAKYEEASAKVEEYEKLDDAGASFTRSEAFGQSRFSENQSRNQLSDKAAEHISDAVSEMVTMALDKKYNEELCMGILAAPLNKNIGDYTANQATAYENLYKLCVRQVFKDQENSTVAYSSSYSTYSAPTTSYSQPQTYSGPQTHTYSAPPPPQGFTQSQSRTRNEDEIPFVKFKSQK